MKTLNFIGKSLFPAIAMVGLLAGGFTGMRHAHAALDLSNVPLFLVSRVDPNVMFSLSVESPMGGAAYNDQPGTPTGCTGLIDGWGSCYDKDYTYKGYFDSAKCYTYSSARFNPVAGKTYYPTLGGEPDCSGDWSGNFLNWLTMTATDIFRHVMTGGDRAVDSETETVLDRATATVANNWFPGKRVGKSIGPFNVDPATVSEYETGDLYCKSVNGGNAFSCGSSASANEYFTDRPVQVKVCDNNAGLEKNCATFGTGEQKVYKPVGLIQKYSETMRFGVMSYLRDNSESRDGGVLRARMKYTGKIAYTPSTENADAVAEANPNREWDDNGILLNNPDFAVNASGVIRYINLFERNGYKSKDPIGELYYEVIRYFKNLGPTPEYSSGATEEALDAFPAITDWNDPIQAYCQKNFIVAINDANPWLDKRLPGTFFTCDKAGTSGMPAAFTAGDCGEPNNKDPAINVTTLTNEVGRMEGLYGDWASTGTWTSGSATGALDGVGYAAGQTTDVGICSANAKTVSALGEIMGTCPAKQKENSYYIAGLAHYANTTDLRSDLSNGPRGDQRQTVASFFIDTQEANANPLDGPRNMLWLAGKYGGFIDSNGDGNPNISSTGTNNLEWDADSDGIPDGYVYANNPEKLVSGLEAAFSEILERSASAAAVATNTTSLRIEGRVYQAKFESSDWSGQLLSNRIDTQGAITAAAEWDAAAKLADQTEDDRVILTRGATGDGEAFEYANLTTAQKAALDAVGGMTDLCGPERVDWLRGADTHEGTSGTFTCAATGASTITNFRSRSGKKLADIVNSNPWHVSAPSAGYADVDHPGYAAFRAAKLSRTPVVYVGGNGGMLHGFNASIDTSTVPEGVPTANSGKEVLAYVPGGVYDNLSRLTANTYTNNHRFFVDSSPMVGDADLRTGASAEWKSVLIGAMGAGGKGYFALDVSDPANFSTGNAASILLWEFGVGDDADMGYVFNRPAATLSSRQPKQIVKMANGKWAAVLANGYNSANGRAVLYIVFLTGGLDGAWTLDTDYIKLTVASTGTNASDNGLSTPVPYDIDGNGTVDTVYAGDLKGNLWKFDVSNADPANWKVAVSTTGCASTSCTPLFIAEDADGNRQPITWPVDVTPHPTQAGSLILLGTGKYLETGDKSSVDAQTFYGLWDPNETNTTVSRADLTPSYISTVEIADNTYRISCSSASATLENCTSNSRDAIFVAPSAADVDEGVAAVAAKRGWLVDLPTSGERMTGVPQLVGGVVFFNTFIPLNAACEAGGTGWLMALDYASGGTPSFATFDTNGDGAIGSGDDFVVGFQVGGALGGSTLIQSADSGGTGVVVTSLTTGELATNLFKVDPEARGRISWRELVDSD